MAVLVGVDAGASRCTVLVADERQEPLSRTAGPPGSVTPATVRQAADAILGTVRSALAQGGAGQARAMVVGAAGAGHEAERAALERALVDGGVADRVRVTTDVDIALVAALGDGPGILLLAGTGSVGCARLPSGQLQRTGGHGWQFGDEGSGYALAGAAFRAVAQAADGRGASTTLTDTLTRNAGVSAPGELLAWARTAPRPAVAALARTVQEVAASGDAVAQSLVEQAARDLATLVGPLATAFPGGSPIPVALAGGVLSPGSPVRASLVALLARTTPRLAVAEGKVDSPVGAIRLAAGLG